MAPLRLVSRGLFSLGVLLIPAWLQASEIPGSFRDDCHESATGAIVCTGALAGYPGKLTPPDPSTYGGLTPKIDFLVHRDFHVGLREHQALTQLCSMGMTGADCTCTRLLRRENDEIVLVDTEAKFRLAFAPVSSPDEAIAFMTILGYGHALGDVAEIRRMRNGKFDPRVDQIEPTTATKTVDGYRVNAYSAPQFDTCTNGIRELKVLVKFDGTVSRESSTLLWESNRQPACVTRVPPATEPPPSQLADS